MSTKKNFLFNAGLSISQILFPLITFPYVARTLLPNALGSINFIDSIVQYIIIFTALGVPIYGVREIAKIKHSKTELDKTFSELIIFHFVSSIFASILFFLAALFIPKLYQEFALCLTGVGLILTNTFTLGWLYGGLEKFSFIAKVSVLVRMLTIAGIFVFVKTPEDKVFYYLLNLVGNIILGGINIVFALRSVTLTFRNLEFKKHLKPLYMLFSLSVISSVYVLLDSVLLGFLTNNTEVGYYSTAMRISKIPIAIVTALTSVLIPKLTQVVEKNNKDEVNSLLTKSMEFTFLLSIPIAMGLFCLAKELILLIAGNEFLPALNAFRVLSFIILPISFALVNYQILLPYNKEKFIMSCSIMGLLVSVVLNFSLIPFLGSVGSAISSISTEFAVAIALSMLARSFVDVKIPFKLIFQAGLTCCMFFVCKYFLKIIVENNVLLILTTTLSGICSYLIMMGLIFKNSMIRENFSILKMQISNFKL